MPGPFTSVGRSLVSAAAAGLKVAGDEIMALSQELVPKDTMTLHDSALVSDPMLPGRSSLGTFMAGDPYVELSYGNGLEINPKTGKLPSEYAVPVHERLEAKHEPPTQAKFLEDAMNEYSSMLGTTVGEMMRSIEDVAGPTVLRGFVDWADLVAARAGRV